MQHKFINQYEYNQNMLHEKNTRKIFSLAIFSSSIMLTLLLLGYLFTADLYYFLVDIFGPSFNTEVSWYSLLIISSILTFVLPFLYLAKKAGIKFSESFKINTQPPKKFWLYLPFALGTGYIINVIINLLFKDLLERFNDIESNLPQSVTGIILVFVLVAIVPAIFEEWAFRGVLLRSLMPYGKVFALIVSSVVFGTMHIGPNRVVFATGFGLLAGFLYIKTGTIWYGALIHLVNNAFSITAGFAAQKAINIEMEEIFETALIGIIVIGLIVTGVIGLVYFFRNKYFRIKTMHHITPPDKPKLIRSQYSVIAFLNGFTVFFIFLYIVTMIFEFFV